MTAAALRALLVEAWVAIEDLCDDLTYAARIDRDYDRRICWQDQSRVMLAMVARQRRQVEGES